MFTKALYCLEQHKYQYGKTIRNHQYLVPVAYKTFTFAKAVLILALVFALKPKTKNK